MQYLKVFVDFEEVMAGLSDAEKGRLFVAMLQYARNETMPEVSGNERFVFPTAKLNIDREIAFIRKQHENGEKGGRKPKETQTNPKKPKRTQVKPIKDKDKDKDNEISSPYGEGIPTTFADFWSAYPRHKAKQDAEKAWKRLNPSPELGERILTDIAARKDTKEWTKNNRGFVPYPATYLNGKRWEDDLPGHGYDEHPAGSLDHLVLDLDEEADQGAV